MKYEANQKSLKQHQLPVWFDDAKLGVIVAWGIYSIPAFAPTGKTSNQLISEEGWEEYYRRTPYGEWYQNSIKIKGSPAAEYHKKKYGESFKYEDFAAEFKNHIKQWKPAKWAEFFDGIGAKYVVYFAKFHDGFLMWPSKYKCPVKKDWYSERDTVKELADAVRAKGLKMGAYYSGAIDWAFTEEPVMDLIDLMTGGPQTKEYGDYADNHYRELIDNIKPDILWNDIAYPPQGSREKIIAHYYNEVTDGCINDRWVKYGNHMRFTKYQPLRALINRIGARAMKAGKTGAPSSIHIDFITPEFTYYKKIQKKKFEAILSFGTSVAYNAQEKESEYHSVHQMVKWFCDIISKNGNLLLVVSPRADGSIPEIQSKRMVEFGAWIKKNQEAIYGSRPWQESDALNDGGSELRFTVNNGSLYAFLPDDPGNSNITIKGLTAGNNTEICLLGYDDKIEWQMGNNNLTINLPGKIEKSPAHVFKISPIPSQK
jgi:alpha-L-fucosidase